MKKLLFIALLALTGNVAHAQAGITITNNNQYCTIYAHMRAVDIANGNNVACDIASNTTIILLPSGGSTGALADWNAFNSAYGLTSRVPLVTTPSLSPTFQWTDIAFQWSCPVSPCLGSTSFGYLSDAVAGLNCFPGGVTWSGSVCNSFTCYWNNAASTGTGDDIVIIFN